MKYNERVVMALVANNAHKALQVVSGKEVVRATRRLVGGKVSRQDRNIEVVLTIGRPNYRERRFIAQCRKAKVKFPLAKVQLRFPPAQKLAR